MLNKEGYWVLVDCMCRGVKGLMRSCFYFQVLKRNFILAYKLYNSCIYNVHCTMHSVNNIYTVSYIIIILYAVGRVIDGTS